MLESLGNTHSPSCERVDNVNVSEPQANDQRVLDLRGTRPVDVSTLGNIRSHGRGERGYAGEEQDIELHRRLAQGK